MSDSFTVGHPEEMPEFTKILPGQMKALVGSDVTLECEVSTNTNHTEHSLNLAEQVKGEPTPRIRWLKDSTEIVEEENDRYTRTTTRGGVCSLTIRNLQEVDSGRYMCEAVNKTGRVSTFVRLYAVQDPKVLLADRNLKLYDFLTVTDCQFTKTLLFVKISS